MSWFVGKLYIHVPWGKGSHFTWRMLFLLEYRLSIGGHFHSTAQIKKHSGIQIGCAWSEPELLTVLFRQWKVREFRPNVLNKRSA